MQTFILVVPFLSQIKFLSCRGQALQKGPKFGTWFQMGPKFQVGPKKVPILLTSPKFLTLPSDAAEKRRHTAVGHCCALFRHIQCIMCMYLILSGPLMRVSYLLTTRVFVFFACFCLFCMFLQSHENND